MFSLQNLNFKYDDWIFRDATCNIRCKKVGIIGGNGIGKTTLLHLLNRDLEPESGEITLPGNTYFVDFTTKNYMYFTPRELISLCVNLNSFEDVFEELVGVLNFDGMLDVCLNKLSLGNLKKVFLMLGLASKSSVVLLDEPFENLDEKTNQNLTQYISACDKDMVIVSHNISLLRSCVDEVYEVADRTLVLR
jgi:ABC-type Mn2+/Zn2+ transport system ATPase subunit